MMYERIRYMDMEVGAVYMCPPGGDIILILNIVKSLDVCVLTFMPLNRQNNIVEKRRYTNRSAGSWSRIC